MITVIDYGLGNTGSIINAFDRLGIRAKLTDSPKDLLNAKAVVFPGDGTAGQAMENLMKRELIKPVKDYISSGRPFLGICLGMQILLSFSKEGDVKCLDIIRGKVEKLSGGLKVPQIGWNQIKYQISPASPSEAGRANIKYQKDKEKIEKLFQRVSDGSYFYFINSYYCRLEDRRINIAETDYGQKFCSVFIKDNVVGVQFHPEKSGEIGLLLLNNFWRITHAYYSSN